MKFYKYTSESGALTYGSGPVVPDDATEITADEFAAAMRRARAGQTA